MDGKQRAYFFDRSNDCGGELSFFQVGLHLPNHLRPKGIISLGIDSCVTVNCYFLRGRSNHYQHAVSFLGPMQFQLSK